MGYRHASLSQRLGLGPLEAPAWELALGEAECFMYFVAHLHQCFGRGYTLYIEGRDLTPDVLELYRAHPAPEPQPIQPLSRHSAVQRLHVALGSTLGRAMNRLAAHRTFDQMGPCMLVYQGPTLWLDGRALNERRVRLNAGLSEAAVRRFAAGRLRGEIRWLEA